MKAYVKDILKEVKNSLGRFCSIMLIVAIGVAFFAGVKASAPDMLNSADTYFDDQNLLDIRIQSTMGLTQDDVDAIMEVDGIEGVNATYSVDMLTQKDNNSYVIEVIAWEDLDEDDPNYINQIVLTSGRLPESEDECLIEDQTLLSAGYEIGDVITLTTGTSDEVSDYLSVDTYTIVGTCNTPDYLSYEKGTATIGSGEVDLFMMVLKDNFTLDYYTEVQITVEGAKAYNSYEDDEYFDLVDEVVASLESIGIDRADIRYEEIQETALESWNESYAEYEEALAEFNAAIEEAEQTLEDAKTQIILGTAELASQEANFDTLETALTAQITQAESTVSVYQSLLDDIVSLSETMHDTYDTTLESYEYVLEQAEEELAELEAQLEDESLSDSETEAIEAQISAIETTIASTESSIATIETLLDSIDSKIASYEAMVESAQAEVDASKAELAAARLTAEESFAEAEAQLEAAEEEYAAGILELAEEQAIGEEELQIAYDNLMVAYEQITNLDSPVWYVLDRESHYSYRDYESVAERMDGIAKVFPVFFILVAALVCLTTMTRMVDEERQTIGTYKALGYSKQAIAMKYVLYAFSAALIGSILGCLVGMWLFPYVIFTAWNLMYNIPELIFVSQPLLAIGASAMVIVVILAATIFAIYTSLMEVPASLMRPKAPKNGKTILLERIPFLWKRFSFSMKVTARNIFRYKKRFFMTVIGISGCTALVLAGFGIKDSVGDIVDLQYEDIFQYDASISLDEEASLLDRRTVIEDIQNDENVEGALALTSVTASVTVDASEQSITILIPDDTGDLEGYIDLRERVSQEAISIVSSGAVITEKLSMNLDIDVGDTFTITLEDGYDYEITVSAITENYTNHYIYMSPAYYKTLTGYSISENYVLVKMYDDSDTSEDAFGDTFMSNDAISSITFYRGTAESFADTVESISFITYVLTAAAALLAFVVLYNLTNVNISERLREIATIKVLGFYDNEVASYVYRENIILTLIGSFVGLGMGVILHRLIMQLAELSTVMFGRTIAPISYVYAVAITMVFGIIVNLVMYKRLKNIPMVESLKSVE